MYFTRQKSGHVALDLETITKVLASNGGELVVQFTQSGKWEIAGSMVPVGGQGTAQAPTLNLRFSLPGMESKRDAPPTQLKLTPKRERELSESEMDANVQEYDRRLTAERQKNKEADKTFRRNERLVALGLILAYYTFGVVYYSQTEDWTFVESIYFVTVTLTTVGYGDLLPTTDASKLMTCGFVFFGIALVGTALGMIASHVIETLENLDGEEKDIDHPWKTLLWALVYSSVGVFSGAILYSAILSDEDMTFLDGFYMAVITGTTVGYGDFSPSSTTGRVLAVFWILASVILTAHSIGSVANLYTETVRERIRKRRLERKLTLEDLQEFGDENQCLGRMEFAMVKLKATQKISNADVAECNAVFDELDLTGDGKLDIHDLVAQSLAQDSESDAQEPGH